MVDIRKIKSDRKNNLKKSNSKKAGSASNEVQKKLTDSFEKSFKQIRNEFEEHLETINENTNEIQGNYEYLCELDSKMDKLSERIEELTMLVKQQQGIVVEEQSYEVAHLTKKEKEVFTALYVLEEESGSVSYDDVARYLCFTKELVQAYMTNLIEKGVPILKRYINNKVFLAIDTKFKALQRKENILEISEAITENVIHH